MRDPCDNKEKPSSIPQHSFNDKPNDTNDAHHTLLSTSAVLNNDARFQCTAEALTRCTSMSKIGLLREVVLPWTVLANDVSTICRCRRMVLRALFEAVDILRSGEPKKKGKKKKKKDQQNGATNKNVHDEPIATKDTIRLARKKVEYYLSWCSANWTAELGSDLANEAK
eukprot:11651294-Ditylum_brightwellii.AAC.1